MGLCISFTAYTQQISVFRDIDEALKNNRLFEARRIIDSVLQNKAVDVNAGRLVGRLGRLEYLNNKQTQFPESRKLLTQISRRNSQDSLYYEGLLGLGLLYVDQGSLQQAQDLVLKARAIASLTKDVRRKAETEYYLAEIGLKVGDFNQLLEHTDEALKLVTQNRLRNFSLTPRIYNYKASLMHFTAKPDSANYYFEKAIGAVDIHNNDPEYRYYLPGTIYGNWVLIDQTAGNYKAATAKTLKSIASYNSFLAHTQNHSLTEKVHSNLIIAYRNLGSIYNDLGEKEKAVQVAELGYRHAKTYLQPNTVPYFSAVLMLGEAYLYSHDLERARKYLEEAARLLDAIPGSNYSYRANLYTTLGELEHREQQFEAAIPYFIRALAAYEASNTGKINQDVVYTTLYLAQVLGQLNRFQEATDYLDRLYTTTHVAYGAGSPLAEAIQLTKIRLLYEEGAFKQTLSLVQQHLKVSDTIETHENVLTREARVVFLFYQAKAQYALLPKSVENLTEITQSLNEATRILEQQKALLTSQEGVSRLLEDHQEVFDFAQKIYLDLYKLTQDNSYLNQVLSLHESALYTRIRTRLTGVEHHLAPPEVREAETKLKSQIHDFFEEVTATQFNAQKLDSLSLAWENHLRMLQQHYPDYYTMRYARVVEPLNQLENRVDSNTSLVRYFKVAGDWYGYVYNRGKGHLISLNSFSDRCMPAISDYTTTEEEVLSCLYELYQQLWKPLEPYITTEDIIIIPEGILYNLPFDLLTKTRQNHFKDLAYSSLLATHTFSYNYSLLIIDRGHKVLEYDKDFVAFVPEFDAEMKDRYTLAISDSVALDRTYLKLLPQPFSVNLAKKMGERYEGSYFINEQASKQVFTRFAREHKIIHLGTHAESNNKNPELSRLVFAKNSTDPSQLNDNYLYTYEIYNQNLNAELAILTGCETGKPGYQPGEGMISLAHAFNYAGSESILTSLWAIDEQSSAQILESFYTHLEDGMPTDRALRQAKLDYLKHATGRTLHPQYWAGLILMGTAKPIDLNQSHYTLWIVGVFAVLGIMVFWYLKSSSQTHV